MLDAHPPRPTPLGRLQRWLLHPMAVPALMAVVVAAIGAQVAVSATIPGWSNDEPPHLGYIASLAEGELPTIYSPTVDDPERFGVLAERLDGWDEAHDHIWTANHPPLFHLLLVPLWSASDGDPASVFIAMRLINTLGFAAWILLVAMIARELAPRRPAVPALAAVAAVTPTLAMRSGFLLNDGFNSAATLLAMLMVVRMLRDDVTRTRVAIAALAGVAAAGTRASGVLFVAISSVVLLVALGRRDGWRSGVVTAGIVGGVPALATSWFYLRNLRLYGDFTGENALLAKFEREPVSGVLDIAGIPSLVEGLQTTWILIAVLLLLSPRVALAARRRGELRWGKEIDAVWVLLIAHALVTLVNIVKFLSEGGGYHDRYLMPLAPLLATWAALGMLHVGRQRPGEDAVRRDWRIATWWSAALLGWLVVGLTWMEQRHIHYLDAPHPASGLLPALLLLLSCAAGCLVLTAFAVHGGLVPERVRSALRRPVEPAAATAAD